jgi:nucleotide-binding universal stress UspA family protein
LQYQVDRDRAKKTKELLDKIKKKFKDEELDVETRIIYDLGPQYYIEKQVKDESFDLVVLGCKGEHSKLRRTVIGTIPEYIINHVNVDVLVAK